MSRKTNPKKSAISMVVIFVASVIGWWLGIIPWQALAIGYGALGAILVGIVAYHGIRNRHVGAKPSKLQQDNFKRMPHGPDDEAKKE